MDYRVKIVPDHALPPSVERVMVEKRGESPLLLVVESAAGNWRFLQEWEQLYDGDDANGFYLRAV
jgi:hypothetical protein